MKEKTLTDLFIELGMLEPSSDVTTLDDHGAALILDRKQKDPQNEEKSRE